jgi:hypothetical protein
MKTQFVGAFALFAGAFLGTTPHLAAQTTSLAGSWQLILSPSSSVTEPVVHALATFTADGSTIETDTSQVGTVASSVRLSRPATAGHGIWQPAPVPGNLFIRFISLLVNPNGSLYAQKTVTITGAMDSSGNNFTGSYSYTITNPIGGFVGGGSGTVTGERIPHPLLP